MLIIVIFFLLFLSFTIHILIVVFYVINKSKILFNLFIVTAFTNISIGMILSIYALNKPESIRDLDFGFILWILSGFVMLIMAILKATFFRKIYLRTKDPKNFHYNFFGKKVLNKGIVKQYEYFTLMLSMPFFLLLGAYFIARLINYFIYGQI
jgi:hypothetical protein